MNPDQFLSTVLLSYYVLCSCSCDLVQGQDGRPGPKGDQGSAGGDGPTGDPVCVCIVYIPANPDRYTSLHAYKQVV